jgi:hypothetical protein
VKRTGYDYIPVPGEDYHPQGRPSSGADSDGEVLADNGRNKLIKNKDGSIVLTDQSGRRTGG